MVLAIGKILAGLGLFFFGAGVLTTALQDLSGRKLRRMLSLRAQNPWYSGVTGFIMGALFQSMSGLSLLMSGMVASGLLQVRNALTVILWGNAGIGMLVFVAFLKVDLVTLYVLGVCGVALIFSGLERYRKQLRLLFGLALLLFGLQMLQAGAAPFAQQPWFGELMAGAADSYLLALLIGALLTMICQSSTAITILAITMTTSGVLNINQTIMIIYGANAGSSLLTWVLSSHLRGSPKQLVMGQVVFNLFAVVVLLPLFYLEVYAGMPLVKALATSFAAKLEFQLTLVYLLLNYSAAILLSLGLSLLVSLLQRYWPARPQEEWTRLVHLLHVEPGNGAELPELIRNEQHRLLEHFSPYLGHLHRPQGPTIKLELVERHQSFALLRGEIEYFVEECLEQPLSAESSEAILHLKTEIELLGQLEEQLYELVERLPELERHSSLYATFAESLDLLVGLCEDLLRAADHDKVQTLLELTLDRGGIMKGLRQARRDSARMTTSDSQAVLLRVTQLFERIVWNIHQLARNVGHATADTL